MADRPWWECLVELSASVMQASNKQTSLPPAPLLPAPPFHVPARRHRSAMIPAPPALHEHLLHGRDLPGRRRDGAHRRPRWRWSSEVRHERGRVSAQVVVVICSWVLVPGLHATNNTDLLLVLCIIRIMYCIIRILCIILPCILRSVHARSSPAHPDTYILYYYLTHVAVGWLEVRRH